MAIVAVALARWILIILLMCFSAAPLLLCEAAALNAPYRCNGKTITDAVDVVIDANDATGAAGVESGIVDVRSCVFTGSLTVTMKGSPAAVKNAVQFDVNISVADTTIAGDLAVEFVVLNSPFTGSGSQRRGEEYPLHRCDCSW